MPKTILTHKVFSSPIRLPAIERLPFVAYETFFNMKSGVKDAGSSANFAQWFIDKIEKKAVIDTLAPFLITKSAYDSEIIAELGGEEKAEVSLVEIWCLLKCQANGEKGALFTSNWNIFYVRDVNGLLKSVRIRFDHDGWYKDADELDEHRHKFGCQVFSHNS